MPIPSSINDLSITAGSNSPAGSESPSLIDDYLRTYASYIALLRDAAQNGAFNYAAAGGSANAITAIYSPAVVTLTDSTVLLLKAASTNTGAVTFSPNGLTAKPVVGPTHLPLQAGEILANGDVCLQYNTSIGGGSWVVVYSTGGTLTTLLPHGQCRLSYVSATSIKLAPFDGQGLIIGGTACAVPSAGITLSNGGMNTSTLYYIYAYMNSGVMTLDMSTTGHSAHTSGVRIKTGDSTRTLVGMIYANASAQFDDSITARHTASWFNRRSVGAVRSRTAQTNFTNVGALQEIAAADRVSFLCWGDESTSILAAGQSLTGNATNSVSVQSYVDGAPYGNLSSIYEPVNNGGLSFTSGSNFSISGSALIEGRHEAQVFGSIASSGSAGAVTFLANSVMTRI